MKKSYLFLLVLSSISFMGVAAQSAKSNAVCQKEASCVRPVAPDLTLALNRWKGNYQKEGINYEVVLSVYKEQGQLLSTISIPQLGINNQKCKASFCSSNELHVKGGNLSLVFSQINDGSLKGSVHFTNEYTSYALAMGANNL